ncbi:MAG TPA: thioredoxin domain-containing protein [Anaerolineae bacterium]|nr:thioredoxin domain-containing protein [Anaerolineae bacterium]
MPNRLANETSPYLLQHADNPVDWYPWSEEALRKAQDEDKPIFLSIGYSACHWCHVMAHESFEDPRVAEIMNAHFVNVKVDREERPDLDQVYMSAVQATTGSGGWPMSVFMTPQGEPFYGGTYFPPQQRHGMPSFAQVLLAVADAWQNRRQELVRGGQQLATALAQQAALGTSEGQELARETLDAAYTQLEQQFDPQHGGWDAAPKFPQPMALEFLLRYHYTSGSTQSLDMVTRTLEAMARGGMYDQIGGGFHRYSVDDHWLVPHFEKMLYDNAQLARVYLHAWQVTGNEFFRTITEEILDYVMREMMDPGGGFYSTQDADSEGEEGKYFVWTPDEIRAVLDDEAEAFMEAYGVTREGNFEGKNILQLVGSLDDRERFAPARRKLLAARAHRVSPGRDDKVLASWNGLMLAAFAEAGAALDPGYSQVAERNADFLLHHLMTDAGRMLHTWKARDDSLSPDVREPEEASNGRRPPGDVARRKDEGGPPPEAIPVRRAEARINGFLEDYSYVVEGLLALYQVEFDPRWYQAAQDLADTMITHFRAPGGGFYDTSDDHEGLIVRPRDIQDNATPSGNAIAAMALLKLAGLAVEPRYVQLAEESLRGVHSFLGQYPLGFGQWLVALDYALSRPREIAIVGEPGAADTRALLETATAGFRPHQVVAMGTPGQEVAAVPLLTDRPAVDGRAAAYVCQDFACQAPVTEPDALRAQLD